MPIYRIYRAADGSQASMFPANHTDEDCDLLSKTVDGVPMVLEAEFFAARWASALKVRDFIMYGEDGLVW